MSFITSDLLPIIIIVVFLLISSVSLVGHIFNLPGNFVILGLSVLLGWYDSFENINIKIVVILVALALLGELVEFLVGVIGAKKYNTSNKAIIVSIIFGIAGGILFAPLFLGFGALLGAFCGAYIGALLVELLNGKSFNNSLNSAWGVFLGKIGGTFSKIIIGVIMIIITMKSALDII